MFCMYCFTKKQKNVFLQLFACISEQKNILVAECYARFI